MRDGAKMPVDPKVVATDENTLKIGIRFEYKSFEGGIPLPMDALKLLSVAGLKSAAKIEIGSNLKDLLQKDKSLLDALLGGVKVSQKLEITNNFKSYVKLFLDKYSIKENNRKVEPIMAFLPLSLIEIGADIDVPFEDVGDLDEIKENVYVQKVNKSLEQLAILLSQNDDIDSFEDFEKLVVSFAGVKV